MSPAASSVAQMMPNVAPLRRRGAPVTTRSLGVSVTGRFRGRAPARAVEAI